MQKSAEKGFPMHSYRRYVGTKQTDKMKVFVAFACNLLLLFLGPSHFISRRQGNLEEEI